ncbi:hypothetical protein [Pseudoduganella aquatica]|uniref:Uncharacterized protein n=1 Tax=Pseudoduganella aquatica TaxID=2660641 RepID=A0A7X4HDM4_9BURK|nr:hypothetical protein [Pseudoduganella aquatica]MYN09019.1 hypothetical protein [Pseudoduganella aquatica]
MAYRWETSDSVWLEDDESGQFELASSQGLSRIEWQAQARTRLPDVAQLLGASLPAGCAHAAIYPEGFAYCPECGAALRVCAAAQRLPAWWGPSSAPLPVNEAPLPRHAPHGLPLTALPLAASLETRPPEPQVGQAELKIPAPPNAVCVFAAADFGFAAQRLLALAYTRNVLQYWDPAAMRWHVMTCEDHLADLSFSASAYAWLPAHAEARRGEVGLVPSGQGLVRLLINPVSESFHTEVVLSARLASAPGMVGRRIACLIAAAGGVRLWTADAQGADGETLEIAAELAGYAALTRPTVFSTEADVIPDPDADGAVPAGGWSRPLSYDGKLMWLHAQGHLVWRPGSAPQWLPWPAGWTPRLQFGGPARSRDGRLWQIGHDGQAYSFSELGVAQAQQRELDGARLGFGTLLFRRGHQVKNEPWDVEDVEDQTRNEALVLPLLENVSSTRSQPTGLVLRMERPPAMAEDALGGAVIQRTLIEWVGQRNVILDEAVRLSHPADCQPFVYDNCLWLHHPGWNEIRGWHLKALP